MKSSLFAIALLFLSLLTHSSCKKEPMPEVKTSHNLNFDNLAIGQKSLYLSLQAKNQSAAFFDAFNYDNDTLLLEVINQDSRGFQIRESLHYVGETNEWLKYVKDLRPTYILKVVNDTLKIIPASSDPVFSFIWSEEALKKGLPLADVTTPETQISGLLCPLSHCPGCINQGFVTNYTQFQKNYGRLNVRTDNSPMSFDGDGETFLYSRQAGLVRYASYNTYFTTAYGWDLLP